MSFFKFQWFRSFVRKHTSPIPEERAYFWKNRLSLAYMLLAWNGFGLVLYMAFSGQSDWIRKYQTNEEAALSPAQQWSRTLGIKEAKVIRISGLNVSNYEIHNTFDEEHEDEQATKEINGNEASKE